MNTRMNMEQWWVEGTREKLKYSVKTLSQVSRWTPHIPYGLSRCSGFFLIQTGPRSLRFKVSRSHTHTHPVGLLWTSDHLGAEAATNTRHNKQKIRTSMTSATFQPAIPAVKWPQTYALDSTATVIGGLQHGKSKYNQCSVIQLRT